MDGCTERDDTFVSASCGNGPSGESVGSFLRASRGRFTVLVRTDYGVRAPFVVVLSWADGSLFLMCLLGLGMCVCVCGFGCVSW